MDEPIILSLYAYKPFELHNQMRNEASVIYLITLVGKPIFFKKRSQKGPEKNENY